MGICNLDEACNWLMPQAPASCREILELLSESRLIGSIRQADQIFYSQDDLRALRPLVEKLVEQPPLDFFDADLFFKGTLASLQLPDLTVLLLKRPESDVDYAYYAAIQNLVRCACTSPSDVVDVAVQYYFADSRLLVSTQQTHELSKLQSSRASMLNRRHSTQFANSAYYMGSKRSLGGFLVEALSSVIGSDGMVLDLMCGSGSASAAIASVWPTHASDAMDFCQNLAIAQGGGYSANDGISLSSQLISVAREHSEALLKLVRSIVDREDSLFHRDLDKALLNEYQEFQRCTLTYPKEGVIEGWNPSTQVELRKRTPRMEPFCLFTAYFGNVFFGFRQCVEIDSLRFAIQRVSDPRMQALAMGALIASCSATATSYAGHFAQPVIRNPDKLTVRNVGSIIEKRAKSIFHEFEIRLCALSKESEKCKFPVQRVVGPWRSALNHWSMIESKDKVVYIDAPYKREEYSRYYHVLETLVKYNYPGSTGTGRMPERSQGEIFQSEFFTRNEKRLESSLSELILSVLESGSICAWSYSNSGTANIAKVLEAVSSKRHVSYRIFSTPYSYSGQGGMRSPKVDEYLIVIR